jgi:hypothetical protein
MYLCTFCIYHVCITCSICLHMHTIYVYTYAYYPCIHMHAIYAMHIHTTYVYTYILCICTYYVFIMYTLCIRIDTVWVGVRACVRACMCIHTRIAILYFLGTCTYMSTLTAACMCIHDTWLINPAHSMNSTRTSTYFTHNKHLRTYIHTYKYIQAMCTLTWSGPPCMGQRM